MRSIPYEKHHTTGNLKGNAHLWHFGQEKRKRKMGENTCSDEEVHDLPSQVGTSETEYNEAKHRAETSPTVDPPLDGSSAVIWHTFLMGKKKVHRVACKSWKRYKSYAN